MDIEKLKLLLKERREQENEHDTRAIILCHAIDEGLIPKWNWLFGKRCPFDRQKLTESNKGHSGHHILTCPKCEYEAAYFDSWG